MPKQWRARRDSSMLNLQPSEAASRTVGHAPHARIKHDSATDGRNRMKRVSRSKPHYVMHSMTYARLKRGLARGPSVNS